MKNKGKAKEAPRPLIDGATPLYKRHNIDKEKLKRFLPKGLGHNIDDEIIDYIDKMGASAGMDQGYAEELVLTHMGVLKEVKVPFVKYLEAIKFVALTNGGLTNQLAYEVVFPDKIQELIDRGSPLSTSWSAMYNSNPLVIKLRASMYVSPVITHAPLQTVAVNSLANLMAGRGANGEKASPSVQKDAAIGMLNFFKEDKGNVINIGTGMDKEEKSLQIQMNEQLAKIAENQLKALESGKSLEEVQRIGINVDDGVDDSDVIDAEVCDE